MSVKTCVVLKCGNSSIITPEKLFIPVPTQVKKRKKWLLLARTDPKTIVANSNVFMCEDHFNIQKDIPNYMKYKMGFTQKIILSDGALPSKFDCNEDHKRHCSPGTSQACLKKQRLDLIKTCEEEISLQNKQKNQHGIQIDNNIQVDRRPYRWCAVPGCTNTSVSTPNKIFVSVPQKIEMRRKWFEMAGRNSSEISENTGIFFCEDHFDLPNDMVNYMRYRVMGSVKQIMMRPGCLPSKFDCQKGLEPTSNNPNPKNKKRLAIVPESLEDNFEADDESVESNNIVLPPEPKKDWRMGKKSRLHLNAPRKKRRFHFKGGRNKKNVPPAPTTPQSSPQELDEQIVLQVEAHEATSPSRQKNIPTVNDPCESINSDIIQTQSDTDTGESDDVFAVYTPNLPVIFKSIPENLFKHPGTRCPMIQIPLSTNQFAPPVESDTDSEADYGTGLFLRTEESVVPTENLLNETHVEVEDIKVEIAEEVLNNVSMYCDDQDAQSLQQACKSKGELTLFGGFQCSVCDGEIVGFRYTCVQCSDFDLCSACENNRAHQQHYVLRVPALNPYPDIQSVLATIRRHLMEDLDPIAELDPDPGESVKSEITSGSDDEMGVTIENDGFDNVETSVLFEDEQVANIPSVRPVAVITVKEHDSSSTRPVQLDSCDEMRVTSGSTDKSNTPKRKFHITMSELPDVTKGSDQMLLPPSDDKSNSAAEDIR